ncbi:hypothetical protein CCACVL1_01583 [Corchorus capsularis]|uniref:PLAC8 motif-containing protein n=1 Tax=Corchorus capsularis TaxID=210143 RepID=A0A1R3KH77_COCAP|nr:hypothetical protein CCACVL1_01583 [Corchorus capsularis]
MYSTNQPKSPLVAGQEVPATGIPIASPNQQYHPPPPTTQSTYVQSPAPVGHQQHAAAGTRVGRWSTGLFDCFSDVPNCCITFWCPCITFGQIAEIVDQGSTFNDDVLSILRSEWSPVRGAGLGDRVRLSLLLFLSIQIEESIHVGGWTMLRLLRSFLLRGLRLVSRISRAQEPRIRHVPRMAWKHDEDAKPAAGNGAAADGSNGGNGHEKIKS